MDQPNKDDLQIEMPSLPKGGGAIQGLANDFAVESYSGEGRLSIPIHTTPCRDSEPHLSLDYHSFSGNGLFGMGFSMENPQIFRKSDKHIPLYGDDSDIFIHSEMGELVFVSRGYTEEGWIRSVYQPRYEEAFSLIEHWKREAESYWRILSGDNSVCIFGKSEEARIADPEMPERVFAWNQEEVRDSKGNRRNYRYFRRGAMSYLTEILYGNYFDGDKVEKWCFSVVLDYGDHGPQDSYVPVYPMLPRADAFTSYRSGFRVTTEGLCRGILLFHRFEAEPVLVRAVRLEYDENPRATLLKKVLAEGFSTHPDGTVWKESLPPLELDYTTFCPEHAEPRALLLNGGELPYDPDSPLFHFVDLYGQGIPGLLYGDGNGVLYSQPLGEGGYDGPMPLDPFPIDRNLPDRRCILQSVEGTGRMDLSLYMQGRGGLYEWNRASWGSFRPFAHFPNTMESPQEFADLQGDGRSHVMQADETGLRYYPSLGKSGYDAPENRQIPADFPLLSQNSERESILFLDFFGDGLSHRVRVANGCVECWPNIGYGRFGSRRSILGAPFMAEGFDARRVYFADIDGSGTQDIIYAHGDRADIYLNQCGVSFSAPLSIPLPEGYTDADRLHFGDICGKGCQCLVLSRSGAEPHHRFWDFCPDGKPYLLRKIQYNNGLTAQITYTSSASLYLDSLRHGEPWSVMPPFPIHVVAETVLTDVISTMVTTTVYRYRDGYYDTEDKQFHGFACVLEKQCITVQGADYHAPPACTDRSYHIGPYAAQADKARKGRLIREQVSDGGNQTVYTVTEHRYEVRELLAPSEVCCGSYFVYEIESIQYRYDGDIANPAITQRCSLMVDPYGCVTREAEAYYPEQSACGTPSVTITTRDFYHHFPHRLGLCCQTRSYEANMPPTEGILSCAAFDEIVSQALMNPISYGRDFVYGKMQARLYSWKRSYFWDEELKGALPLGSGANHALYHHNEEAVYPQEYAATIYGEKLQDKFLSEDGGYLPDEGYWWWQSAVAHYLDAAHFYLQDQSESPALVETSLYRRTRVIYDAYCLMPVEHRQWLGEKVESCVRVWIDYGCLAYRKQQDINDNFVELLYDPLGRVVVSTHYGTTCGAADGNTPLASYQWVNPTFEEVTSSPERYLQGASAYYCYDCGSLPMGNVELKRLNYATQEQEDVPQCHITFWDGSSFVAQEKWREGSRWAASGQAVRFGEDRELLKFLPYYSDHADFECRAKPGNQPTVAIWYDPMQRPIREERLRLGPGEISGVLFSETEYSPWSVTYRDYSDTILDSSYYRNFMEHLPAERSQEQVDTLDALQKAERFYNTPTKTLLDIRGQKVAEQYSGYEGESRYGYDCAGHLLHRSDPRQQLRDSYTFRYRYDMRGTQLCTENGDKGCSYTIASIFGDPVHAWDANGRHTICTYDALGRLSERTIAGTGLVERMEYGEILADGRDRNLWGAVYRHFDQSGVETQAACSIAGLPLEKARRFCEQPGQAVDWTHAVPLESREYKETLTYNAQQKVIRHTAPDNTTARIGYDGKGRQTSLTKIRGNVQELLLGDITYNLMDQPVEVVYGNGVTVAHTYDPVDNRALTLRAVNRHGAVLQNLQYTYDPLGNVTRVRDCRGITTYRGGTAVKPLQDYTYDGFRRLVTATGRELPSSAHPNDLSKLEAYVERYEYDGSGNLIAARHQAASTCWTRTFAVEEDSNRLQDVNYDAAGNPLSKDNIRRMEWTAESRLSRADVIQREETADDTEAYDYDYSGKRVRKTSIRVLGEGVRETTQVIYVGDFEVKRILRDGAVEPLLERSTWNFSVEKIPAVVAYHWEEDRQCRETDFPGVDRCHYLLNNNIHSVCYELDGTGACVRYEEYTPYGDTAFGDTSKAKLPPKQYRYCAKERDSATGLYYYGARYYDPCSMRMISPDDVSMVDTEQWMTLNLYCYCCGNPVTYLDVNGNYPYEPHVWNVVAVGNSPALAAIAGPMEAPENMEAIHEFAQHGEYLDGVRSRTNCYAYAFNLQQNPLTGQDFNNWTLARYGVQAGGYAMQPGMFSGGGLSRDYINIETVVRRDAAVLGMEFVRTTVNAPLPAGAERVALVTTTGAGDYHWYREDAAGQWSHKRGASEVTNLDAANMPIADPQHANRDYGVNGKNYNNFVGFFYIRRLTGASRWWNMFKNHFRWV